jgi:4-alpha-glucanotransferase
MRLLKSATDAFVPDAGYQAWVESQQWWLEDFALFMALKEFHGGVAWTDWETGAALRDPDALADWRARLGTEIEHHRRVQALSSCSSASSRPLRARPASA